MRRRRFAALGAIVLLVAAIGVAFAVAAPHLHRHHAAPPPPPPPPRTFKVVFPEGFTRAQMTARVAAVAKIAHRESGKPVHLNARQYVAATRRATIPCFTPHVHRNLEGFLFPATYDFIARTTPKQLVASQLQAFCRNWAAVGLSYAHSKNLTPYDVLKIASLIQGEAVVASDAPKIAAVIYNRLHLQMPLGIDAALRYALHIPGTKSIHESELQNATPYNLRLHLGLPPTPIDNPGLTALKAAAHPAHVDYLYFVAKPDKRHHFFTASGTAFQAYECQHGYGC